MDIETAHKLTQATNEFYSREAESFSSTRDHPWSGWERTLECLRESRVVDGIGSHEDSVVRVLDVGCGNMRFERFLQNHIKTIDFDEVDASMIDVCEFPQNQFEGELIECDIIDALERNDLESYIPYDKYDLSVAFGFMHHIPIENWRCNLMKTLIDKTRAGGIISVSFWQPLLSERLSRKMRETTKRGQEVLGIALDLEAGDGFLGWKNSQESFRYCHHFSDAEIDYFAKFAQSQGCTVEALFSPDLGGDATNVYLILRR